MRLFSRLFQAPDVIARADHEALLAEKDARIFALTAELGDWKATLRRAMTQIEDLTAPKPEPVAPEPPVRQEREPSIVAATIRELSRGDTRVAGYFHARKRELRAEHPNMTEDGIAALLGKWETSEDAFAGEPN